ncbi:MBL fold metallo-hydrolase [Peptoniphilus asaccharolyticus]
MDPSEADLLLQLIKSKGYILEAVLLTHKHQDHIGGVRKLAFFHHPAAVDSGLLRQG